MRHIDRGTRRKAAHAQMSTEQTPDINENEVRIEQLQPQNILSIRSTIPIEQLGEAMGERIQTLTEYVRRSGAQPSGPPFVRYHTFGEGETDFEFGVPVARPVESEGRIVAGQLPGGPAITTWHFGPHDKLGDAYAHIQTYIDEQGHEPSDPALEVYHWIDISTSNNPSDPGDPSTWRTQVIQPIK